MTERTIAVVTGAGKGIGRAIALRLARSGYVVVASSRTEADLVRLESDIATLGSEARTVVADAMERAGAKAPVELALETFGKVDVLVNNIGGTIGRRGDPLATSDDDFDMTVIYTLSSPWWSISAALPSMQERHSGRIVNIGSGSSKYGTGPVAYVAAKHGIAGMTKALAVAAAKYNITVNCVCPGWTNTPRMDFAVAGAARGISEEQARSEAEALNAQHRILEPEEVAEAVAFVASEEAHGITGQVISVDGGLHI